MRAYKKLGTVTEDTGRKTVLAFTSEAMCHVICMCGVCGAYPDMNKDRDWDLYTM